MIAALRDHRLRAPVVVATAVGAAWAAVAALGPARAVPLPCPLLSFTGIACPFCGGTRTAYAVARGDVVEAAGYNLVAVVAAPVLALLWVRWVVLRAKGEMVPLLALSNRALVVIGAGLLLFSIVRNLPFGAGLGP